MSSYDNDLFYLCSLIEYIARKTYNTKKYIVNKIGKDFLVKIYLVEIISLKSSFEMFPPVTIIAVFLPSKR